MPDALGLLLDAVGLTVGYDHEVAADSPAWTLTLRPAAGYRWIASSSRTTVWVGSGHEVDVLRPGSALLVRADEGVRVGTGPEPDPAPTGSPVDPFSLTGVHLGTVGFGALAPEALPLPRAVRTRPLDAPSDDVLRALGHLEALTGARWSSTQRDTLGRTIVLAVLRDNPPVFLTDGSLTRVVDALVSAGPDVDTRSVLAGSRSSERTLRRRFAATVGCSPDALRRWYRSLAVRAALERTLGAPGSGPGVTADRRAAEHRVAAEQGFATTASMRRALLRAVAPDTRVLPPI